MTIESTLERIAVALEKLAEGGAVATATSSETGSTVSPRGGKSGGTSKKSSTKSQSKATEKSEAEESAETKFTLVDVRKALTELQKAKSPADAKELLSSFNATTLSKLEESDYGKLIAKAQEMAAE